MFKTPGIERFVYLDDGRKLFLPRGPGGPVYLVPDLETHLRLEQRYTLVDKVTKVALGLGVGAALVFKQWGLVVALVLIGQLLPRWIDRVGLESLPEVHDPDAIQAARAGYDPPGFLARSGGILIALAAAAPAAYLTRRDGTMAGETATVLVIALLMLVFHLSELNESRADDDIPRGHADYLNTPIEPK